MDSIKHEAIIINMRYPTSSIAPRGDKVPEFGNINIENVTTKYARHALRMQGLSNQPIQGINVKDFFCKSSNYCIRMDSSQNIKLENIKINSTHEVVKRFEGNRNITIKNVELNGEKVDDL